MTIVIVAISNDKNDKQPVAKQAGWLSVGHIPEESTVQEQQQQYQPGVLLLTPCIQVESQKHLQLPLLWIIHLGFVQS